MGWGAYSVEKGNKRSSRSYSRLFSLIILGSCCPCSPTSIHQIQRNLVAPYHKMSNSRGTSLRHSLTHSHRLLLSSALLSSPALPLPLSSNPTKPHQTPQTVPTLLLAPLSPTETSSLVHAHHIATSSPPFPTKQYLKITDTTTNEIIAYLIWVSLPPCPPSYQRYHDNDPNDPWQLVTGTKNNDSGGLSIGTKERLCSNFLYHGVRVASKIRRLRLGSRIGCG